MATERITLTEHQADFIRQRIDAGDFQDVSEVIQAALELFEEQKNADDAHLAWLRAEIQKGMDDIEPGRYIELNTEEDFRAHREEIHRRGLEILAGKRTNVPRSSAE